MDRLGFNRRQQRVNRPGQCVNPHDNSAPPVVVAGDFNTQKTFPVAWKMMQVRSGFWVSL
jgi:endonuclease/exonuclease/phosphatase family metal-dependent hydrolase